jgi:hypothetical protein
VICSLPDAWLNLPSDTAQKFEREFLGATTPPRDGQREDESSDVFRGFRIAFQLLDRSGVALATQSSAFPDRIWYAHLPSYMEMVEL